MPQLNASIPEMLMFKLDQEAAFRNRRDGLDDVPASANRKWSRSNVVCADLAERYGVECPSAPQSEGA